jgi:hypothetical protein
LILDHVSLFEDTGSNAPGNYFLKVALDTTTGVIGGFRELVFVAHTSSNTHLSLHHQVFVAFNAGDVVRVHVDSASLLSDSNFNAEAALIGHMVTCDAVFACL